MPIVWPAGLPQELEVDGLAETPPDLILRTPMDAGPAKLRRRFTAGERPIEGRLKLTTAEVATLDTFFVTTTAGGALSFEWTHPRTGSTVDMRFIGPPRYRPEATEDDWAVELTLEILP